MNLSGKYSVLLPVYRMEKPENFKKSIDSMLNQTVPPGELIIMEDGELTRELEALATEYESKYEGIVRVNRNPINQGLGLTLKEGVCLCKFDYIARMDSDDISELDRIEREVEIMNRYPELDAVGCIYDEFVEEGVLGPIRMLPETPEEIYKFAHKRNPFGHSSLLIKKQSILDAGNYRDYPRLEDYDLWLRMLINGAKFYNIQDILIHVRGSDEFYKRRGGMEYFKQQIIFFKEYRKDGFISNLDYINNLLIRGASCLMPDSWRNLLYRKLLRKE